MLLSSCTNNGDESSRPDPQIDSTAKSPADTLRKDANDRKDHARTGDSTGTRSPHLGSDSLRK